jgi:Helix-turn-helix domain
MGAKWVCIHFFLLKTGQKWGVNAMSNSDQALVLLTTEELAKLLRCQPETLANWRRRKRGPAYVRVAGRVLYDPSDVRRWLADHLRIGEQ